MQTAIANIARNVLALILCILLSTQIVLAKNVSLDITNANRKLDKHLKSYHKAMRERIEAEWRTIDPHCGKTMVVEFLVLSHGKIVIPKIEEYLVEEEDLRLLPVTALHAVNYLPALPAGQSDILVIGEFISEKPPSQSSDGQTRRRIKMALAILAGLAVAGGAVVGLIALNRSMNSGSGNESTDYVWVRHPHRRASDGVWVEGYWRSRANGTMIDNFSTYGNVNPFTGQPGYVRMP